MSLRSSGDSGRFVREEIILAAAYERPFALNRQSGTYPEAISRGLEVESDSHADEPFGYGEVQLYHTAELLNSARFQFIIFLAYFTRRMNL
jgi:hypothetical protein